jgi:hypothetical protein
MQCDHKPVNRPWRVDFLSAPLKPGSPLSMSAFGGPRHGRSKEVFRHTSTAAVLENRSRIAPWKPP